MFVVATAVVWVGWAAAAGAAALERGWPSDVLRQWIVGQYLQQGLNPYPLSREVLADNLGPRGLTREIPQRVPDRLANDVLPPGPPEATYPPPASALLAVTLHHLSPRAALVIWLMINLVALAAILWQLALLTAPGSESTMAVRVAALAWLAMGFTAPYHAVASGQLALPVFACLLYACRPGVNRWLGGLALALALLKPSVALPFLILPLTQRRRAVVVIALGIQGLLLLALSAWLGVDPFTLTTQWLDVARHFMVSFFGIQHVLFRFGWVGTPVGTALTLAALVAVFLLAWLGRRAAYLDRLAFVCLGSLLWTYHLGYDFVAQLPVWLLLLGWDQTLQIASTNARARTAAVFLLIAVSNLAYFPPVAWEIGPLALVGGWLQAVVRIAHLTLLGWLIWRLTHLATEPAISPRSLMHPAQPSR